MSLDKNKSIVRGFVEAYNKRDLSQIDDFVAPDYIDHTHQLKGRESLKQLIEMGFKAFPDWQETIEDIIAEGIRCGFVCPTLGLTLVSGVD